MTNTDLSRRTVLGVLGGSTVAAVAGCSAETEQVAEIVVRRGARIVATADVTVGSGVIVKARDIVVTQPSEGSFVAFSAICTHQGCPVGTITGDEILCPCHGSVFSARDGSVVKGPAEDPLAPVEVTIDGDQVVGA